MTTTPDPTNLPGEEEQRDPATEPVTEPANEDACEDPTPAEAQEAEGGTA